MRYSHLHSDVMEFVKNVVPGLRRLWLQLNYMGYPR